MTNPKTPSPDLGKIRTCHNASPPHRSLALACGYYLSNLPTQLQYSQLDNKIVVAWDAKKGLSISRFRRYRGVEVLEPENREYESVILSESRGWRIVGKVLWWIGKAP